MRNKGSTAVLSRLKRVTETNTDSQLASALSVSPQTLSSWKGRDSIPYAICIDLAEKNAISLDWLLTGEGPMLRRDRTGLNAQDQTHTPRELELLDLLRGLNAADQQFIHNAAQEKKRLRDLEQRVELLSASLAQISAAR
ncbi:helix-turn-helix domain-containing protein [Pseudomonas sp. R5(2019)]|uniref:helix-turn-helix domain-containing protein n=1 Tax=Pseudomonas sp. R5(2019) TaxID=2697566 RepID=UPI0014129A82|nr:helix-turn-helix domain-containing protein [Pseudomonas sp. R5(2019)]NBA94749.1 transcriptional regulator [Pseudomonas sp. R5(2019)]